MTNVIAFPQATVFVDEQGDLCAAPGVMILREQPDEPTQLQRFLAQRSPEIRARILRLNPHRDPGAWLKGWHPGFTVSRECVFRRVMTKGQFIRRYGREAWNILRWHWPGAWYRLGRRFFVTMEAVEDRLWEMPRERMADCATT